MTNIVFDILLRPKFRTSDKSNSRPDEKDRKMCVHDLHVVVHTMVCTITTVLYLPALFTLNNLCLITVSSYRAKDRRCVWGVSRFRVSILSIPYFLSRELKISFDAQAGAMPLLGHHTPFFVPAMRSELPLRARTRIVSTAQPLYGSIGSTTTCSLSLLCNWQTYLCCS